MNPKKPSAKEAEAVLISNALERQMLGLSIAEYSALTPLEIDCELKAHALLQKQKETLLRALDEHLARLEILANGYNFPTVSSAQDFRIFPDKPAPKPKPAGDTELKWLMRDAKNIAEFKKRREELRKQQGKQ